jgi:hypothetical protein
VTVIPYLHDAELTLVEFDRWRSRGRLSFCTNSGDPLCIANLHGVDVIRCEDFVAQNVVLRLTLSSDKRVKADDLLYWVNWVTSFSDSTTWYSEKARLQYVQEIEQGKCTLFALEPSTGAQFAAVCTSVVFESVSAKDSAG